MEQRGRGGRVGDVALRDLSNLISKVGVTEAGLHGPDGPFQSCVPMCLANYGVLPLWISTE